MGRRTFVVKPVEQLQGLTKHNLHLCDTCVGCDLQVATSEAETTAWKRHRQGRKVLVYQCNSYSTDPKKARVAPPLGDGKDA